MLYVVTAAVTLCLCFAGLNDMSARLQQLNDNYQRQHRINAELTERSRNLYRRHVSRASAHLPPSHVNPFDDYDPPDLQSMNRNVADAFMSRGGVGEPAVSSSIGSITHRIQRWDLNRRIPDIFAPKVNMVLRSCKLHNDATADISQDGRYLATFVSTSRGLPDDTMLGVFSLQSHNLGQCLYTKSFGSSALYATRSHLSFERTKSTALALHVALGLALNTCVQLARKIWQNIS